MKRRVTAASLLALAVLLGACGSAEPPDVVGLSPRNSPGVAWVNDRLFVFGGWPQWPEPPVTVPRSPEGGVLSLTDGALFDPDTMAMDQLPQAPFPNPVQYPRAVAVGDEVVIIGTDCPHPDPDPESSSLHCDPGTYAAAVYSTTDDEWRQVAMPPALDDQADGSTEVLGATQDGRAVFVLGPREDELEQLWSYAPAEDRWERLPDPGAWANDRCLAGDTLAMVTGAKRLRPSLRLLTLTDDDPTWREAAAPSLGNLAEHANQGAPLVQLDCTDDRVLFRVNMVEPQFHSVLPGDEQDEWAVPSPSPAEGRFCANLGAGDRMIFLNCNNIQSAVYDPSTDEWQMLEGDLAVVEPVWTGDAIAAWPGGGATQPLYIPFRPIA